MVGSGEGLPGFSGGGCFLPPRMEGASLPAFLSTPLPPWQLLGPESWETVPTGSPRTQHSWRAAPCPSHKPLPGPSSRGQHAPFLSSTPPGPGPMGSPRARCKETWLYKDVLGCVRRGSPVRVRVCVGVHCHGHLGRASPRSSRVNHHQGPFPPEYLVHVGAVCLQQDSTDRRAGPGMDPSV